jgi:hypothetical protein
MPLHRYAIGARVWVVLDRSAESSRSDIYTVSRLLPVEAKVCQYRVKRVPDGQERLVREDQLISIGLS